MHRTAKNVAIDGLGRRIFWAVELLGVGVSDGNSEKKDRILLLFDLPKCGIPFLLPQVLYISRRRRGWNRRSHLNMCGAGGGEIKRVFEPQV